jgi:hypothetical protein
LRFVDLFEDDEEPYRQICLLKSDLSLLTDILRTMKFDIHYCVTLIVFMTNKIYNLVNISCMISALFLRSLLAQWQNVLSYPPDSRVFPSRWKVPATEVYMSAEIFLIRATIFKFATLRLRKYFMSLAPWNEIIQVQLGYTFVSARSARYYAIELWVCVCVFVR